MGELIPEFAPYFREPLSRATGGSIQLFALSADTTRLASISRHSIYSGDSLDRSLPRTLVFQWPDSFPVSPSMERGFAEYSPPSKPDNKCQSAYTFLFSSLTVSSRAAQDRITVCSAVPYAS